MIARLRKMMLSWTIQLLTLAGPLCPCAVGQDAAIQDAFLAQYRPAAAKLQACYGRAKILGKLFTVNEKTGTRKPSLRLDLDGESPVVSS